MTAGGGADRAAVPGPAAAAGGGGGGGGFRSGGARAEPSLGLAFMRTHPAQAARVLESLPPAEAAALLARTPARLGAAVLTAMLPRRAAGCLEQVDDARALGLLAPMATQPTVAALRHLPEARRRALIAGLPTAASLASALLLGFTEDTLGAWADPDVVLLPVDTRAAAALARMHQSTGVHPTVFVADVERRLVGSVGLARLLQAPAGATLASLMRPPEALLPAVTPLSAAAAHPGWAGASVLPVVEPGDRLVGVVTRDALTRALRQVAAPAALAGADTLPGLLATGYWQALVGLLEGALALLPKVPPVRPDHEAAATPVRPDDAAALPVQHDDAAATPGPPLPPAGDPAPTASATAATAAAVAPAPPADAAAVPPPAADRG